MSGNKTKQQPKIGKGEVVLKKYFSLRVSTYTEREKNILNSNHYEPFSFCCKYYHLYHNVTSLNSN